MKQVTDTSKINDMRGNGFAANFIELNNGKLYYCGMPVETMEQASGTKSKYYYDIFGLGGFNIGLIALTEQDYNYCIDILENPADYATEHPQTPDTGDTVSSEVGLKLWVTGSGNRAGLNKNDVLLRTDDATIHLSKETEFGKLAHAMIDRYNNHDKLVSALKELIKVATDTTANLCGFDGADELDNSIDKAKELLNNISNK